MVSSAAVATIPTLLQVGGGLIPRGSRVYVFNQIFTVFMILGTVVGIVVFVYMLRKAWRYRAGADHDYDEEGVERPQLGELPSGSGGGRKLFVSFSMSAIIVISVIAWTYGTLLFVETGSPVDEAGADDITIEVIGSQFTWEYVYPNGYRSSTMRVPQGTEVRLRVTSSDVFHNFGAPGLRVKTDAMPGEYTETWFLADETGTYHVGCYELCGAGHSYMTSEIVVMEPSAYEEWYANTEPAESSGSDSGSGGNESGMDGGSGASHSVARAPALTAPATGGA